MRARAFLVAILGLAAALRLWRLDQNGFGNEYYAAAVRSMASSAHNFFYAAFDPAGFVSVDKPPVALWIQVASVKVLGFNGFALLLPQVLEGVAAVGILFHLVRRRFGAPAAANASAAPLPMPRAAPVRTTTCPVKSKRVRPTAPTQPSRNSTGFGSVTMIRQPPSVEAACFSPGGV